MPYTVYIRHMASWVRKDHTLKTVVQYGTHTVEKISS